MFITFTSALHTFTGKHEKELDEKNLFVNFARHSLTVYQRAMPAI